MLTKTEREGLEYRDAVRRCIRGALLKAGFCRPDLPGFMSAAPLESGGFIMDSVPVRERRDGVGRKEEIFGIRKEILEAVEGSFPSAPYSNTSYGFNIMNGVHVTIDVKKDFTFVYVD